MKVEHVVTLLVESGGVESSRGELRCNGTAEVESSRGELSCNGKV